MTMKSTRALMLAAAVLLPVLGGCSKSEPDAAPAENLTASAEETPVAAPEPIPEPSAAAVAPPTDTNATAEADPEPATPPDEQMLDDASATGMTARASRDEPADTPANEEVEQK
jgi:hypothetical protein